MSTEAFPETTYDFGHKYTATNFVSRRLIDGFFGSVRDLVRRLDPDSALEVGSGEGYSTKRLRALLPAGSRLEASDVEARLVAATRNRNPEIAVAQETIYRLQRSDRSFDLVIALEVLEHLEDPERGLRELFRVSRRWVLVSVPREPLWRALNMTRGAYLRQLGNTPGHVNHWSTRAFRRLVSGFGAVIDSRSPIPWTMLLARTT